MGTLSEIVLAAACAYGRFVPVRRGKNRLIQAITPLIHRQREASVDSIYGTRFRLRFPEDVGWESLYVLGSYEAGTSALAVAVLQEGDVVVDVGANLGWYSMLFNRSVRPTGSVHAFEPVPWIRQKLEENCILNDVGAGVILNDVGLGAGEGTCTLYSFAGLSHGETSARPFDGARISSQVSVRCMTLDQYVSASRLEHVALVKIDIEGGEQDVLRGSRSLLASARPPMWILEVNFRNAAAFGWSPPDLFRSMQRDYDYCFLRIPSGWRSPVRVSGVEEFEHGDNVLCYRPDIHAERLRRWNLRT
jgi:FkbM family methyltransferase